MDSDGKVGAWVGGGGRGRGGGEKKGVFDSFPSLFISNFFFFSSLLPFGRNCMRESSQLSLASSSLRLVSSQFLFSLSPAVDIGSEGEKPTLG